MEGSSPLIQKAQKRKKRESSICGFWERRKEKRRKAPCRRSWLYASQIAFRSSWPTNTWFHAWISSRILVLVRSFVRCKKIFKKPQQPPVQNHHHLSHLSTCHERDLSEEILRGQFQVKVVSTILRTELDQLGMNTSFGQKRQKKKKKKGVTLRVSSCVLASRLPSLSVKVLKANEGLVSRKSKKCGTPNF